MLANLEAITRLFLQHLDLEYIECFLEYWLICLESFEAHCHISNAQDDQQISFQLALSFRGPD